MLLVYIACRRTCLKVLGENCFESHFYNWKALKVFTWAITEFQSSSRIANAIWQWAKVGRYHFSVKIRHKPCGMKAYRSTYGRTFFFRRRRFLRFWTIKWTFITFACKNQHFVVDLSLWVFTSEKVNWPAAYSWITLDSRHMTKIPAAAYLRKQLIREYIRHIALIGFLNVGVAAMAATCDALSITSLVARKLLGASFSLVRKCAGKTLLHCSGICIHGKQGQAM